MKTNLPITQKEKDFNAAQRIVSSTNKKGVITFVNDDFIDIAGFTEEELIGQAHNIVRHPDMPQAAFKDLWDTAGQKKPWMGIVKNRCKNGDHYWVDAFVTPMDDDGETTGFQSVRLKPDAATVARAEQAYQALNQGGSWWQSLRGISIPQSVKQGLVTLSALAIGLLVGNAVGLQSISGLALMFLVAAGIAGGINYFLYKPWASALKEAEAVFDNPLARYIYTGRQDELGQFQLAIRFLKAQQHTIIWRTAEEVSRLKTSAEQANAMTSTVEQNMSSLHQEVDMVSTAMTEMESTVQEVATNTEQTSVSTHGASDQVEHGRSVVQNNRDTIEKLSGSLVAAEKIIQQLATDSEQIGSVVDVINGVAEQTNLLALNAAIEAARAGEMGRGFAVVADEVRGLAGKTQSSTGEINQMIQSLQQASQQAVNAMDESKQAANHCVAEADQAVDIFNTMTESVTVINDMSTQIATAAEEQTLVCSEISRNVVNISQSADGTLDGCRETKRVNSELAESIDKLNSMISQFSV